VFFTVTSQFCERVLHAGEAHIHRVFGFLNPVYMTQCSHFVNGQLVRYEPCTVQFW